MALVVVSSETFSLIAPLSQALPRGRTVRCAKSRPFFTTGSHGSQGPEFCTLQPLLVHQGFFVSVVMLATGPRILNSAPPMLF